MSEARAMLTETADRVFADLSGADGAWAAASEAGFAALLTPDAVGGFGGDWGDLFAVARLTGVHALPAPVSEEIVATWALGQGGLDPAEGPATLAPVVVGDLTGDRFTGEIRGTPWGRHASVVVASFGGRIVRFDVSQARLNPGESPAGEPRDTLVFDGARVASVESEIDLFACGAFVRAAQIAGALDAALAASIAYANERSQFGRAIAKFQTVQQSLATFAVEAAAVNSAGQSAARAADRGDSGFEFAAAKLRANGAAGLGGAVAHQIHGAIGFTDEHPLHRWTRRLIAWRSEFGGDRFWAEHLGRQVAGIGADGLWAELTRRGDAASRSQS